MTSMTQPITSWARYVAYDPHPVKAYRGLSLPAQKKAGAKGTRNIPYGSAIDQEVLVNSG